MSEPAEDCGVAVSKPPNTVERIQSVITDVAWCVLVWGIAATLCLLLGALLGS